MKLNDRPHLEQRIIEYLYALYLAGKLSPTFREIAEKLCVGSTNTIDGHLKALERDGFITRGRKKARSIQLSDAFLSRHGARALVPIPLVGKISAGAPIRVPEAGSSWFEAEQQVVEVSRSHLQNHNPANLFALVVDGDLMIDACVLHGDIIIMKHIENPSIEINNGDMVAAWIIDKELTTLKRYYYGSPKVELRPENPRYNSRWVEPEKFTIQGKFIYSYRLAN